MSAWRWICWFVGHYPCRAEDDNVRCSRCGKLTGKVRYV